LGIAYKQICSDEEIEKKKKEDNEAILSGIDQGLLDDSSEKSQNQRLPRNLRNWAMLY